MSQEMSFKVTQENILQHQGGDAELARERITQNF